MPKEKLQQQTSSLRTDIAAKTSEPPRALGSNRDALGLSALRSPAPALAEADHIAPDSTSGKTLSPMSAGLGGLSANAPIQARKKTEAEKFNEAYAQLNDPVFAEDQEFSKARIEMLKETQNKSTYSDMDSRSRDDLDDALQEKLNGLSDYDAKTFIAAQNSASQDLASPLSSAEQHRSFKAFKQMAQRSTNYKKMAQRDANNEQMGDASANNEQMGDTSAKNNWYDDLALKRSETDKKNLTIATSFDNRFGYSHQGYFEKAAKRYKYQIPKSLQKRINELKKKKKK